MLFPAIEPVGYHVWVSDQLVSMFILGESFTLQQAALGETGAQLVADNIGRSLRRHPRTGETLFVDKNPDPWRIAAHQSQTGDIRVVVDLFPGNEDFTVDSTGTYWTGNGSKLYKRSPGDSRWQLVADLQSNGIRNISRLAVHLESGKLALVNDS